MEQHSGRAKIHLEGIHFAVAIVIAETGPAAHTLARKEGAGVIRDVLKFTTADIAKYRMLLRHQVNQTAVEDQNVAAADVIRGAVSNPHSSTLKQALAAALTGTSTGSSGSSGSSGRSSTEPGSGNQDYTPSSKPPSQK